MKLYCLFDRVTGEVKTMFRCVNDEDAKRSYLSSLINVRKEDMAFVRDTDLDRVLSYVDTEAIDRVPGEHSSSDHFEIKTVTVLNGQSVIDQIKLFRNSVNIDADHDEDVSTDEIPF